MAKKKKKAAAPAPSFDPARFRMAEEAAYVAPTTPTAASAQESGAIGAASIQSRTAPAVATPTSAVDEQSRIEVTGPVTTLKPTGAQRAAGTIAQRNQRFQEELARREATKPTEDPGPGNIWSYNVAEGRWKRVFTGAGLGGSSSVGGGQFEWMGAGDAAGGETGDGQTFTAPDGRIFTDLNSYNAYIAQLKAEEKRQAGQSAYDLLFEQFNEFGLGGLVESLKGFITEGLSRAEFTLRLRDTDAYKKRFAANQARIQKGLRALSEAEYIGLEDEYQERMRRYGLPESYYARGEMGRQEGFEKFIANDVSPVELEDRIQTAQRRVLNAAPQIKDALTQYYGNEISNGDILAYVLDPGKAIENIKRKVTAAEIGAGAAMAGLGATKTRAEELGAFGVTGEQARQGFQTIADVLPTASKLGDIYSKQGLGPYTQATAEQEVFGITGAADAAQKRRRLSQLETAEFSGQAGTAGGALARERAGQF